MFPTSDHKVVSMFLYLFAGFKQLHMRAFIYTQKKSIMSFIGHIQFGLFEFLLGHSFQLKENIEQNLKYFFKVPLS